jgi:hypothetical protein
MKFLYSDTHDYVDPNYDFIADRNAPKRKRYWDDVYAHELMKPAPYDGLLISMSAAVQADGVPRSKVRYSTAETQRLLRSGARSFLRLNGPAFRDAMVMGDCGAFSYASLDKPAFTPQQVVDFYNDVGVTHGVSPDHIIFDCDTSNPTRRKASESARDRYDITLQNAESFLSITRSTKSSFEPMGAIQGWSPESMGTAAASLQKMGYRYLAVGGLVPLKPQVIHEILKEIRQVVRPSVNLHLLGFAKAEHIHEFTNYGITSFDSTSPLIRAFKDAKANYYMASPDGGLVYYSAIRIPQAIENTRLLQGIKKGVFVAEDLQLREQRALGALRAFDKGRESLEETVDAVTSYQHFLIRDGGWTLKEQEKELARFRSANERTLRDAPWKRCGCSICRDIGVDVIIFRSSNRNKRRGFHNLGVYHNHLKATLENSA